MKNQEAEKLDCSDTGGINLSWELKGRLCLFFFFKEKFKKKKKKEQSKHLASQQHPFICRIYCITCWFSQNDNLHWQKKKRTTTTFEIINETSGTSQDIISFATKITPPNPSSTKICVPDFVLLFRNESTDETTRRTAASSATPNSTILQQHWWSRWKHTHKHAHIHSGCD